MDSFFSPGGPLALHLSSYEERSEQIAMSDEIWRAFDDERIALIEAGTGIGKSMAYLVPALRWSAKTGEKIVISTFTIALQQQLFDKDIPLLLELLELDLNVALVKGMSNYLCLHKMEAGEGHEIKQWARLSAPEIDTPPFPLVSWRRFRAEAPDCFFAKCPHYKRCYFFKARKMAEEADVLIVNHHLLMADLYAKQEKGEQRAILPSYDRVIVDEAHHLEEVALQSLSRRLNSHNVRHQLDKIERELKGNIDLMGQHHQLMEKWESCLEKCGEGKKRWKGEFAGDFVELSEQFKRYAQMLSSLKEGRSEASLLVLGKGVEELGEMGDFCKRFSNVNEESIYWIEREQNGCSFVEAQVEVASYLQQAFFAPLKSAVLCSATLKVGKGFEFVLSKLGIPAERASCLSFHSPFDYKNRTLFLSSASFSLPDSPNFILDACEAIEKALEACGGGAFLLFTSFEMLEQCYKRLAPFCKERGLPTFKQGDLARHDLLSEFKIKPNSVLFGADSFWEGVDVPGGALRCVVIVKLPFKSPGDPLVQARTEHLQSQGRDPFAEESLPRAVVKFRQGFGRLIRQAQDRGCVLCLDRRLLTRSYGKVFLQSLPECLVCFGSKEEIFSEMQKFYTQVS